MATKVKDATLSSVDFVRSGANQDAHIALFKSNDNEAALKDSLWERFKSLLKGEMPLENQEELKKSQIAKAKQTIKDENQLYTSVLKESMDSIIFNDDLNPAEKHQMMQKSMEEFTSTMDEAILKWRDLDSSIAEIEKSLNAQKGETMAKEEIKKPEELEGGAPGEKEGEEEMEIEKAFKAEMDSLRKSMEEIQKKNELDEQRTIAKKYTLLGKSEEELANTLYAMKKSNEDIYKQYVSLLDENLAMVEKSGIFSEIGKSGNGTYVGTSPEAKIEKAAEEIRKSDPKIGYYDSIEKAWEQNPELAAEYDKAYAERR